MLLDDTNDESERAASFCFFSEPFLSAATVDDISFFKLLVRKKLEM
jgi:hypothetical protein